MRKIPSAIAPIALAGTLAAGAGNADAQVLIDESLLWDQRLYETEALRDLDRPLQLRVYGGMRYDSNLFRLSDEADAQSVIDSSDRSDYVYQVGAGGRYELRKGRQKVVVEGAVEHSWYQNFDNLDNTSNLARAQWAWQAGNDWSGTLGFGHRRYLESFINIQQNVRDMVDRDRAYGSARYRPLSWLRFTADLDWTQSDHSAPTQDVLDYRSVGTAFTTDLVSASDNSVGLKVATAESTYPNSSFATGALVDNSYRDNEYSVVAVWHVTAASQLKGRLGHTERRFDQDSSRDFSGPTWRLGYEWEPSGKTALELAIWRELTGFEDLSGNYMRTTGVGLFPAWSVTPKIVLQAKAAYQTRDYIGDVGGIGQRKDRERVFQVATVWTPLRMTKLVLALETGDRNSNQALVDYDYSSVALSVMRTF